MNPKIMIVDRKIAAKWLARNNNNRNIRPTHVAALARAMTAGNFNPSTDAIGFSVDGELVNGQHRLSAIVETGISFRMIVVENIAQRAIAAIDTGKMRSAHDAAKYQGLLIANIQVATIRAMMKFGRLGISGDISEKPIAITNDVVIDIYKKYRDTIDTVYNATSTKISPICGPVLAVAARAIICGKSTARVVDFIQVLESGVHTDEEDSAAIAAGAFLRGLRGTSGYKMAKVRTRRTENALRHFIDRQPVRLLRATRVVEFPMPSEDYKWNAKV